jgi:hypothetical protein
VIHIELLGRKMMRREFRSRRPRGVNGNDL